MNSEESILIRVGIICGIDEEFWNMFLSDYLEIGDSLENIGVFDPVLDKDNAFFINIQRLKETTTPEFQDSYEKINDFFRKIIKLLNRAEWKSEKDTFFRAAFEIFKFSEVNGIGLGFGEKAPGSGFGSKISRMVLETASTTATRALSSISVCLRAP